MNIIRFLKPARSSRNGRKPSAKRRRGITPRSRPERRFSIWERYKSAAIFMGGSSCEEVRPLPASEVNGLIVDGTMLIGSLCFITVIWSSALATTGMSLWAAIPVATLVALLIGAVDRMILSALLAVEGASFLKSQRVSGFYTVDPAQRRYATGGRIALSVAMSLGIAILVDLQVFNEDIKARLAADHRAANAELRGAVSDNVDRAVVETRARFRRAVAERNELRAIVGRTDAPPTTEVIDTEIAALQAQVTQARTDQRNAHARYREYQRAASAEEEGVQDHDTDSGDEGRGDRYDYARAVMGQSAAQLRSAMGMESRAVRRIQQLEIVRRRSTQDQTVAASRRRGELAPRLAAADQRVTALENRLRQLETQRPETVRHLLEADPNFRPLDRGLLARLTALGRIQHESFLAMLLSLTVFVTTSILEMAVVWSRVVLGVASSAGVFRVLAVQEAVDKALAKRRRARAALRRTSAAPMPDNDTDPVDEERRDAG